MIFLCYHEERPRWGPFGLDRVFFRLFFVFFERPLLLVYKGETILIEIFFSIELLVVKHDGYEITCSVLRNAKLLYLNRPGCFWKQEYLDACGQCTDAECYRIKFVVEPLLRG